MIRVRINHLILSLLVLFVAMLEGHNSLAKNDVMAPVRVLRPKGIALILPHRTLQVDPLETYRNLHQKRFLNADEQLQLNQLLQDKSVLHNMETRILRTPATVAQVEEQKAAIALVIDALKNGNSEVATEVLQSVVIDGQVEEIHSDNANREDRATRDFEASEQWGGYSRFPASEQTASLAHSLVVPLAKGSN